jgi:hypothetical protein
VQPAVLVGQAVKVGTCSSAFNAIATDRYAAMREPIRP